eukprot:scaffold2188_cov182-Ochromonas_danica.AAC.11
MVSLSLQQGLPPDLSWSCHQIEAVGDSTTCFAFLLCSSPDVFTRHLGLYILPFLHVILHTCSSDEFEQQFEPQIAYLQHLEDFANLQGTDHRLLDFMNSYLVTTAISRDRDSLIDLGFQGSVKSQSNQIKHAMLSQVTVPTSKTLPQQQQQQQQQQVLAGLKALLWYKLIPLTFFTCEDNWNCRNHRRVTVDNVIDMKFLKWARMNLVQHFNYRR